MTTEDHVQMHANHRESTSGHNGETEEDRPAPTLSIVEKKKERLDGASSARHLHRLNFFSTISVKYARIEPTYFVS